MEAFEKRRRRARWYRSAKGILGLNRGGIAGIRGVRRVGRRGWVHTRHARVDGYWGTSSVGGDGARVGATTMAMGLDVDGMDVEPAPNWEPTVSVNSSNSSCWMLRTHSRDPHISRSIWLILRRENMP